MISRTSLVGRAPELAFVDDCLAESGAGRPRLVLCEGEPGIGKTRLAEEALVRAAAHGVTGAWGGCDDASGTPPYWPWRQVLRGLAGSIEVGELANRLRAEADLSCVAPEVFAAAGAPRTTASTPDDRFRQFDAVARLLHEIAAGRPLAIVLDDLHWADEASLLLLGHVATCLRDERILVWANLRDVDGHHRQLLDRCRRSPHARQLHLAGLADDAIREQLETLTGTVVADAELADARRLTDGNPFFVTEVARLLVDRRAGEPGMAVTPGIAGAVAARLRHLSPSCLTVCRAGAVLGQEFEVALVAAIAAMAPVDCVALLAEAERHGLVQLTPTAGRARFAHALVRDAIEADLPAQERVELHRRAAESIEALYPAALEPHAFELARHWSAAAVAGAEGSAVAWLRQAGDLAMRQLAFEDAAHHYAEALRIGAAVLADPERCRLLLARARADDLRGARGAAFEASAEAGDIARRIGDVDLLAAAALALQPGGIAGFDLATRRLCQEVLAALDPAPTALRARVTARFAETFIYLPDAEAARDASLQALTVAEECGDAEALGAALRARQVVVADPEGLAEREQLAARMLRLALDDGDAGSELHARRCRVDASFERGDMADVAAEIAAAARCADEAGGPIPRFWVAQMRAVLAQAQGRFADCRRYAVEAFEIMAPTDHPERFFMRAAVLATAGRHCGQDALSLAANGVPADGAALDGSGLAELLAGPGLIAALSLADVLVTAGRPADAETLYRALGPPAGWRSPMHVALLTRALGVEVAIALDADEDVATLHDQLSAYRGHHVACGLVTAAYMGPVELWLGKANRHLRRLDKAIADLAAAESACGVSGVAPFRVEAQLELAAARAGRGRQEDRQAARQLLVAAAASAARLGMPPFQAEIARLAGTLDDAGGAPALTRREREIAELVAEGMTNREIAQRLFLSERTAQNHVQHILDKLALSNRSQVAVWVERSRRAN